MRRSWIGFFLLLALLAAGALATWSMGEIHEPISRELEQAAESCLNKNWGMAAFHTAQARREWEKWQLLRATLTDHDPTEEIDALFATLEVYGSCREELAFAALSREMAEKIEAIGDAHSLIWKNIL